MYSFKNDYSEGAHQNIIDAMVKSNMEQTSGYGEDAYTEEAKNIIKQNIKDDSADIHFFVGGTQVNLTSICAFLRPHEAAIAAETGHINVHETGAIEATGHKVIPAFTEDGKLTKEIVQKVIDTHVDEHMVRPKLVYISNSTEIGTHYTLEELEDLSVYCKNKGLILFMDGARLGSALMTKDNKVTLEDCARLTDAFYIGATKNGAIMGEALIITNENLKEDFRFIIKQRGALLAKGRMLAIQFIELFRDNLYFDLAKHANEMAALLSEGVKNAGYSCLAESKTNQIFPIFPNDVLEKIRREFDVTIWEPSGDNQTVVRLVTSWATKKEEVERFNNFIKR